MACALWAGIYATLGSIGGRIANHPVWAVVIAIAFAVSVGALVQQLRKLWGWWRARVATYADAATAVDTAPGDQPPAEQRPEASAARAVGEGRDG